MPHLEEIMSRKGEIVRTTRETDISLTLELDGSGLANIQSGVGFLDHMLALMAMHGRMDLSVSCRGDLDVDCHHSVEDIGITLGQALASALGNKAGIARYGTAHVPMDETLVRV